MQIEAVTARLTKRGKPVQCHPADRRKNGTVEVTLIVTVGIRHDWQNEG